MKAFTLLALTIALTCGTLSVQASPQENPGLERCKADIHDLYGKETELKLVDMRRDMNGTSMRISARVNVDNSRFVSCWLPRQEAGSGGYIADSTRLASTSRKLVTQ